MTSVISDDALKGQQSRIMKAMRAATQPALGDDWRNMSMALSGQAAGGPSYMETTKAQNEQQAKAGLDAELGIYNMMKEQAAQGDTEAAALDSAINEVAGNDPKIYAALLQDLHADPENVNARNAKSKVMMYAAKRGIVPMSVQKDKASLSKTYSDLKAAAAGGDDPAAVREFKYVESLDPEARKRYLAVKRTSADEEYEKYRNRKMGAAQGEAENDLMDQEATFPELESTVEELRKISKQATYTKAGKIYDAFNRQLDREPREGAIAREKYINTVRDQVLPLLRQTFGAAFTKAEGDSLVSTLGDPEKSPLEKEAALDAFIAQKRRNIISAKRRAGKLEEIPEGGNIGVNTESGGIKFLGFE